MVFAPVSSMISLEFGTPLGFQLLASPQLFVPAPPSQVLRALKLTIWPVQSPLPVPLPVVEYVPVDETIRYVLPVANEVGPAPILLSWPVVNESVHGLRVVPPTCEAPPNSTAFGRVVVMLPVLGSSPSDPEL